MNIDCRIAQAPPRRLAPATRLPRAALLAAALLAASPVPAPACGYHVGLAAGFTTAHASSIAVAMAIGGAVEAGRVAPLPDAPAPLALVRANNAMHAFASTLGPRAEGLPPVALVLVEAHLWGRITSGPDGVGFAPHVDGPADGDVIVVTGEPVLRALLAGRIAWDAAVASRLVIVDGPPGASERLARALARRFS